MARVMPMHLKIWLGQSVMLEATVVLQTDGMSEACWLSCST